VKTFVRSKEFEMERYKYLLTSLSFVRTLARSIALRPEGGSLGCFCAIVIGSSFCGIEIGAGGYGQGW